MLCGAGRKGSTGEAAVKLDGGLHASIFLVDCEAVSAMGQPDAAVQALMHAYRVATLV